MPRRVLAAYHKKRTAIAGESRCAERSGVTCAPNGTGILCRCRIWEIVPHSDAIININMLE